MNWRNEISHSIRSMKELSEFIDIPIEDRKVLDEILSNAPMQISRYYLNLINKSDKNDPIRNLIVPSVKELSDDGLADTSRESENTKMLGLQHKYEQTALIIPTQTCAAYCRFCFRKRMAGKQMTEAARDLSGIYDYLRKHVEVDNVLLTGGDPLTLNTASLEEIIHNLRSIESVKTIRIGTRVSAYLPQRIYEDARLLELIKNNSYNDKRIYIINHFDHPRELTKEALKAQGRLFDSGAILRNQTVLLRGVNDNPQTLAELFNKLSYSGITPYYLFQCRPVKHALHFAVPIIEGYQIFEAAKLRMNGLAKRARYIISHHTGKIEILAVRGTHVYLKYHQARNESDSGKFFIAKLSYDSTWLNKDVDNTV